ESRARPVPQETDGPYGRNMETEKSWGSWILAGLWTGLALFGIIAIASTPDDFGLNGVLITFLVICWAVGLAVGAGVRALIRSLRRRRVTAAPEGNRTAGRARVRLRLAQLALGLVAAGIFAGLVYATSGADRASSPLTGLRWTDETPAWSPNGREV